MNIKENFVASCNIFLPKKKGEIEWNVVSFTRDTWILYKMLKNHINTGAASCCYSVAEQY